MRIRITFSKSGTLRYTGHLDLHRIWERTCRRAGIPLSYSQGFHPQPRISLAAALPLGFIGQAELVDLWLDHDEDINTILKDLQASAPPGLILSAIQSIDQQQAALQTQVKSAEYEVQFLDPIDPKDVKACLATLFSSNSIPRQRRGKDYDLLPLLISLELKETGIDDLHSLTMRLSASPGATGRPEEVLAELGFSSENTRITRTRLFLNTV
ncbi:MAG: TIGR03936 family radical SAM-associated protein [Chloroflexota bacterium]